MSSDSHGLMEIVVGDINIVAPHTLGDLQMSCVRRRQACFSILTPKEIDRVDVTVPLRQVRKVSLKSRL